MQFFYRIHANLVRRFGVRTVRIGAGVFGILVILLLSQLGGTEEISQNNEPVLTAVTVLPIRDLAGTTGTIETVGKVEAVNEARLLTERGGRITSVRVRLGDRVQAGTVIATIENSAEQAAVLQAQGVYEAAEAGAATSDIGSVSADRAYEEAVTQATNAYRGALATSDTVLRNTVNDVFSFSGNGITGVRIDSRGRALELLAEQKALAQLLAEWTIKANSNLETNGNTYLAEAEVTVTRLQRFVTTLTALLAEKEALPDETELAALRTEFATARTTLNTLLQTLSSARSALISAQSAQEQAAIAATNGDVSLADAQVKQALGALRLAQSNLEKTIIRSPLAGIVNTLDLKVGTTISAGAPAAVVSSTGGFEIVAYANENDAKLIRLGTPVVIEDESSGVITRVASAVDATTKKIEVRIGVQNSNGLLNGETVRVTIPVGETDGSDMRIFLPVVAIKMTPEGPVVFSVSETNTLIEHEIILGAISGDRIAVTGDIDETLTIVTDARGLRAGETVVVQ